MSAKRREASILVFFYYFVMVAKWMDLSRLSRTHLLFLQIAWAAILAKCIAIVWAVNYWSIPINPAWVIVPTLVFAGVVTLLALTSRE